MILPALAPVGSVLSILGAVLGAPHSREPGMLRLNEWGPKRDWTVGSEQTGLNSQDRGIVYRFHARDLHLVRGLGKDGKPVRFRLDTDRDGLGSVTGQRLYQLVRQGSAVAKHTFEIAFLDPSVQVYAFTFG